MVVAETVAVTSSGPGNQMWFLNTCWVPGKVIQRKCDMAGPWQQTTNIFVLWRI